MKFDRVETAFILALFYCLKSLTNEGFFQGDRCSGVAFMTELLCKSPKLSTVFQSSESLFSPAFAVCLYLVPEKNVFSLLEYGVVLR